MLSRGGLRSAFFVSRAHEPDSRLFHFPVHHDVQQGNCRADRLDVRHDNVKVAIERLALRSVVTLPSLQEVVNTGPCPRTIQVYQLDKCSSLIVVDQLSPEFTARMVEPGADIPCRYSLEFL
ncbi:hypothetical protein JY96_20960 [Aquabacterium sp. NJ1]|nr:hypothetical protein JY96_20960 [Aquabacterium sp. NJ1]